MQLVGQDGRELPAARVFLNLVLFANGRVRHHLATGAQTLAFAVKRRDDE